MLCISASSAQSERDFSVGRTITDARARLRIHKKTNRTSVEFVSKRLCADLVNFEVPVVFERDVAHEEGVFVEAEEECSDRRQVGAVEGRNQHKDTDDIERHSLQLHLDHVRPVDRQQHGNGKGGIIAVTAVYRGNADKFYRIVPPCG